MILKKSGISLYLMLICALFPLNGYGWFNFDMVFFKDISDFSFKDIKAKHILIATGAVGAIAGTIGLINYLRWTDEKIIEWATQEIQAINTRYDEMLTLSSCEKRLTYAEEFGLTQNIWDKTILAAAPLHHAKDRMDADIKTLTSIMYECLRHKLFTLQFIDEALKRTRQLLVFVHEIEKSREYRAETVELERIQNSRESLSYQRQMCLNH